MTKVRPYVEKQKRVRDPISVDEKLGITLRFLATGESYKSPRYQFRISHSAISLFIKPVCDAIYDVMKDEYLKMPSTEDEWKDIANKTFQTWHFPNCFAAADGKHIQLMHPHNSGSLYINYKGFFVLFSWLWQIMVTSFNLLILAAKVALVIEVFFGTVTSMEHLFATNSTFHYQLKYHH